VPKVEEVMKDVVAVAKDAVASEEPKSFFAKMCSCMGGSKAPKDTDTKTKEVEKVPDSPEKEEVEEVPVDVVPATVEAA
jgi:hypothetical protein